MKNYKKSPLEKAIRDYKIWDAIATSGIAIIIIAVICVVFYFVTL